MSKFIPVLYKYENYGNLYPEHIKPNVEEISANFDVENINPVMNYSLHTEYSFGEREFKNNSLNGLDKIKSANKDGIPKLWFDKSWSEEFAHFIKRLTIEKQDPKIVEVHPPFKEYCETTRKFVQIYKGFEDKILNYFPNTDIVIENRIGSLYNSDFLLETDNDIEKLINEIAKNNLKLRMVLDLPQLLYSKMEMQEFLDINKEKQVKHQIKSSLSTIRNCREYITGIHVWGQKKLDNGSVRPHFGDLNTFFASDELKKCFLDEVLHTFNDGKERYFVPEVNSGKKDYQSVVNDFVESGYEFV